MFKITKMTLKSKVKVKSNILTVLWLVIKIPLTISDGKCSYLALSMFMVCRLQGRFQISTITLESKAS